MNAYTVSRLAHDAGVSMHVVRDYMLRGALRPVGRTAGGYGLFDADGDEAAVLLAELRETVERRRQTLADLDAQLARQMTELARNTELSL